MDNNRPLSAQDIIYQELNNISANNGSFYQNYEEDLRKEEGGDE